MAWCPKCRNEYRDGIFVCADCGEALVATLEDEAPKNTLGGLFSDEQLMGRVLQDTEVAQKLREEGVQTPEEHLKELKELDPDMDFSDALEEAYEEAVTEEESAPAYVYTPYRNSSQVAEENRSSGWILLGVGSVGLIAGLLSLVGVIPFKVGNPYMFYGVMFALFILFIVMGLVSIRNAKVFERKAQSENSLESTLLEWAEKNLSAELVDEAIASAFAEETEGAEEAEEILYFKRSAYMKSRMNHQFVNLDQGLLDHLVDDILYDKIFEA